MQETETNPFEEAEAVIEEEQVIAAPQDDVLEDKERELDDQLEILDPINAAPKTWKLHHPDDPKDGKEFVQRELTYTNKLRFFRLLSSTIRLAAESDDGKGLEDLLADVIGEGGLGGLNRQGMSADQLASQFAASIMRLIELAPEFVTDLYILMLQPKASDRDYLRGALEELDDDTGFEMLELFVAQNAKALQRFFVLHLRRVGERVQEALKAEE
jgi:hypothetical protein